MAAYGEEVAHDAVDRGKRWACGPNLKLRMARQRASRCCARGRIKLPIPREGVTHVIFGQTARSRLEMLGRGSTLDRFLGAVPDAAVQVVRFGES